MFAGALTMPAPAFLPRTRRLEAMLAGGHMGPARHIRTLSGLGLRSLPSRVACRRGTRGVASPPPAHREESLVVGRNRMGHRNPQAVAASLVIGVSLLVGGPG